jgi:hypothetical protein
MRTSPRPRDDTHSCPHTRHGGAGDGAAEGIQPSANGAQSFGNARCETPQPAHSQETRKHSGHQPTENATDGRQTGRRPRRPTLDRSIPPQSNRSATSRPRIAPRPTGRRITQPTRHRACRRARPPQTRDPASWPQTSTREAAKISHCRKEYGEVATRQTSEYIQLVANRVATSTRILSVGRIVVVAKHTL